MTLNFVPLQDLQGSKENAVSGVLPGSRPACRRNCNCTCLIVVADRFLWVHSASTGSRSFSHISSPNDRFFFFFNNHNSFANSQFIYSTRTQSSGKRALTSAFKSKMDKFYSSDTQRRGKRACMVCSIVLPKSVCFPCRSTFDRSPCSDYAPRS